jgi:hypothetical protein
MNKLTDAVLEFSAMLCVLALSIMIVLAYGGYPR